jgi:hypothetical protein
LSGYLALCDDCEATVLFLFNDRILTILGGPELVTSAGMPAHVVTGFKLPDAVLAAQTAIMSNPAFASAEPEKAMALAWLIASRSQANAAMFVAPARCKQPQQVGFRLATVSLTTLGALKALQDQGRLNPATVNASVWQAQAA